MTDHKPLTKLLGDRTLDEISNPRLFRLKQRTLSWRFKIKNIFRGAVTTPANVTSRNPINNLEEPNEDVDSELAAIFNAQIDNIRAVT